jgi:hypothetical protein
MVLELFFVSSFKIQVSHSTMFTRSGPIDLRASTLRRGVKSCHVQKFRFVNNGPLAVSSSFSDQQTYGVSKQKDNLVDESYTFELFY